MGFSRHVLVCFTCSAMLLRNGVEEENDIWNGTISDDENTRTEGTKSLREKVNTSEVTLDHATHMALGH